MFALFLLALLAGSLVCCALTVAAAVQYRAAHPPALREPVPISVLKPLAGLEEGLEANLASFFEQDYPFFEILFAVHSATDPALKLADSLRRRYPAVPSRVLITGEPPYPNAKVYSLHLMLAEARHDLLVMADSDVRVTPGLLSTIAAEFQDQSVGLATCPYRAVPERGFWSTLEAIGLNTEFIGGVLLARMVDGMKFALGPTIAARRETLAKMGGFAAVKDYLAEDFVLGKLAAENGYKVLLSSYVIDHHIGGQRFMENFKHRLRWNRSTRRSRPMGYIGQIFNNPLIPALVLWAVRPDWWPAVALAAAARAAAGWATAWHALRDPLTRRFWWLAPVQDVASFVAWAGGFQGNIILWRGRKYLLFSDGRFEPLQ